MTSPTVTIPFKDRFAGPMLNGQKVMTSRTHKMADKGDIFHIFGGEFQVERVVKVKLGLVAHKWFREEGVDSTEGFKRIWTEIHPKRRFDPDQEVYLHIFKLLAREE